MKPTIDTPARWRNTFIEWLVNEHGWTRGVELGVWKGDTLLHLLEHCPGLHMIGVDLWQAQPGHGGPEDWVAWDHSAHEQRVRHGVQPYGGRVHLIKDYTTEAPKLVEDGALDFVFIDADHSTEGVLADIDAWAPKLKPSGWFIGHDIDWPTVRAAVEHRLPGYDVGPNVTWLRRLNQ